MGENSHEQQSWKVKLVRIGLAFIAWAHKEVKFGFYFETSIYWSFHFGCPIHHMDLATGDQGFLPFQSFRCRNACAPLPAHKNGTHISFHTGFNFGRVSYYSG